MKFKINILLLLLLALLSSCSKTKKGKDIILIDHTKNLQKKITDRLRIDKIICLKKDNRDFFISSIDKVYITKEYVFILDGFYDKQLYVFDVNGNYLKKLGYYSNDGSPQSHSILSDFYVDENKIIIVSIGKLLVYDYKDLSFINSFKSGEQITRLTKKNNFYYGYAQQNKVLKVFNEEFKLIDSYLDYTPLFSIAPIVAFSNDSKFNYLHRTYENKLYKLNQNTIDTITIEYKDANNFEGVNIKKELYDPNEILDYLINENLTLEVFSTENYFIFLNKYIKTYYSFYNKNDYSKSFNLLISKDKDFKNNLTRDYSTPNIIGSTEDHLIAVINEETISEKDKKIFCTLNFDMAIALIKIID